MPDAVIKVIDPMSQLTLGQGVIDATWLPGIYGGVATIDITVDQAVRALGLPKGLPLNLTVMISIAPPAPELVPEPEEWRSWPTRELGPCPYCPDTSRPGCSRCERSRHVPPPEPGTTFDPEPPTRENPVWKGQIHDRAHGF
jgi:hypothetical protein